MGIKEISSLLKSLDGASVDIGWFESNRYPSGIPVATVAAWNELGTKTSPSRPFVRKAVADGNATIGKLIEVDIKKLMAGALSPEQHLHRIGMHYETAVVDSITKGGWEANAPSTVAKKGYDAPLRDTKRMLQSVTHEISIKE